MRLRNIRNKYEILQSSEIYIENPKDYKGKWNELFKNDNPIHIEIGTGKCKYIKEIANTYPNINFIGIERSPSILAIGTKRLKEEVKGNNIKLINIDAKELGEVFDHEIETIYLNFSDPWPKKKHSKRRLTSETFLNVYDQLFKGNPKIIQKTDNMKLFEFSIVSLSKNGYTLEDISLDLHNSDNNDNIKTEYEEKFSKQGYPIYMLKAIKNISK